MSQVLFSIPAAILLNKKWAKGNAYFEQDGFQFTGPGGTSFQQSLCWKEAKYVIAEEKITGLSLLSAKKITLQLSDEKTSLPKLALDLDQQNQLLGSLDRVIVDAKSAYLTQQLGELKQLEEKAKKREKEEKAKKQREEKERSTRLEELTALQASLDSQTIKLEKRQEELTAQSRSQEERQAELAALAQRQEKDKKELAKERKALKEQQSALEQQQKALEEQRQQEEAQRQSLQAEIEKLRQQRQEDQQERERQKVQEKELQEAAQQEAQRQRERLEELEKVTQDLNERLKAQAQQSQAWGEEKERLSLQIQDLSQEKEGLCAQIKDLEKKCKELEEAPSLLEGAISPLGPLPEEEAREGESSKETDSPVQETLSPIQETDHSDQSGQQEVWEEKLKKQEEELCNQRKELERLRDLCTSLQQHLQEQERIQTQKEESWQEKLTQKEASLALLLSEKQALEESFEERVQRAVDEKLHRDGEETGPQEESPMDEFPAGDSPAGDSPAGDSPVSDSPLSPALPGEAPKTEEAENPSSPKVIAFINMKGGVAKTTTLVGLATLLAGTYQKKVLVIDLDPQTNCTTMLMGERRWMEVNGHSPEENKTLYRLYKDAIDGEQLFSLKDCLQKQVSDIKNIKTIDLLPSSLDTVELEESFYKIPETRRYQLIREAIRDIRSDYDYILIDCPPNLGPITLNGLAIAGAYVIPAIPDNLSTYGIPQIIGRIWRFSQKLNRDIHCLGIVATKVSPNFSTHKRILKEYADPKPLQRRLQRIEDNPDAPPITLFETTFRENNFVSSAGEYQELGVGTVRKKWGYESQNGQYNAFEAFTQEVMERAEAVLGKG